MPPKNILVIFGIFYHDKAKVINYVSLLFAFIFLLLEKFTLPTVFFWRAGHKKNRLGISLAVSDFYLFIFPSVVNSWTLWSGIIAFIMLPLCSILKIRFFPRSALYLIFFFQLLKLLRSITLR